MNVFFGILNGEMARVAADNAASALISGLWQSSLLVAGVGVLLRIVPRTTAAVRFEIWTAVFCVSAAMSFAEMMLGSRSGAASSAAGHLRVDARWSYVIAAVWAVAVLARVAGLAVQGWKLRTLWKQAVPVADEALAVAECSDLLAVRRAQVCTSGDVDRPSVIGFFAPRILIPAWLFDQLSAIEIRHIVLHEMEHLRRRDDWMNLLQKIGLVVFPLNPALFWVDRRMAAERELACDDGVLRKTQMPRAYASCLASIAEMRLERRMHRRVVALALGILGVAGILRGRSEFSKRIDSILSRRAVWSPRATGVVAAVLVASVLGAGFGLACAPQLVSFAPVNVAGSMAAASGKVSASGVTDHGRMVAGDGVREVSFHVPRTEGLSILGMRSPSVPQRLKLRGEGGVYGTAEAVPISKTGILMNAGGSARERHTPGAKVHFEAIDFVARAEALAYPESEAKPLVREQWMVLTSFDEDEPARVVVRMGDGRFYVVTIVRHAAVPIRDGWLIVQL